MEESQKGELFVELPVIWLNVVVQANYETLCAQPGRKYKLFDYFGSPNAEYVVVLMGSGARIVEEVIEYLAEHSKIKYGVVKIRLFRPFSVKHFLSAFPATTKRICVLDRCKEPGAQGEQLLLDTRASLHSIGRGDILVCGGRYGLAGKDFNPAQVKACLDNLSQPDANKMAMRFT